MLVVGIVSASDGIARVEVLPSVMANRLLRFEDSTLSLTIEPGYLTIWCDCLGGYAVLKRGQVSCSAPVVPLSA